jgi:hypothetical protein
VPRQVSAITGSDKFHGLLMATSKTSAQSCNSVLLADIAAFVIPRFGLTSKVQCILGRENCQSSQSLGYPCIQHRSSFRSDPALIKYEYLEVVPKSDLGYVRWRSRCYQTMAEIQLWPFRRKRNPETLSFPQGN